MDYYSIDLPQDDVKWLNILPLEQKELVKKSLSKHPKEEEISVVVQQWIANSIIVTNSIDSNKKFYSLIKKELHKFLCGNPDYKNERKKIRNFSKSKNLELFLVTTLSTIIGARLGIEATVLLPVLVIIFMSVSKITLNSWCQLEL